MRTLRIAVLMLVGAALLGCEHKRTIRVTSTPPGARVWLNDTEIGRTPVEAAFTYYGRYDVRLELEEHEPVTTSKKAYAPVYEWPGIDLAAMLIPTRFEKQIDWHFEMAPLAMMPEDASAEEIRAAQAGLVNRANQLRTLITLPLDSAAEEGEALRRAKREGQSPGPGDTTEGG